MTVDITLNYLLSQIDILQDNSVIDNEKAEKVLHSVLNDIFILSDGEEFYMSSEDLLTLFKLIQYITSKKGF